MELIFKSVILLTIVWDIGAFSVKFPSGQSFTVVDPSTITSDEILNLKDPKHTGSNIFDGASKYLQSKLSLNIRVGDFKSPSSDYYRADPSFIRCVQKVLTYLKNNDKPARILSGFITSEDASGDTSVQALYGRSGCGVQLGYRDGVIEDVLDIAKTVLLFCPVIFEEVQQDLGLVVMADRVHIHMTGVNDTSSYFSLDGYDAVSHEELMAIVEQYTDLGLDTAGDPDCSSSPVVEINGVYPDGAVSPESVVGSVDYPITRNDDEFKKLVQYQGYKHVVFQDTEHSADWCGSEETACVDCTDRPQGNAIDKRCADRVMSRRMYNVILSLQKLVRKNMGEFIAILDAWDEPYKGKPTGDHGEGSLHTEGRAVTMRLFLDNTGAKLKVLAQLAVCAGADYVAHTDDYIFVAVKKMKGSIATTVTFPNTGLLVIDIPTSLMAEYKLPSEFDDEEENYPLFDGSNKGDVLLGNNAKISQFVSRETSNRYFRLRPLITRCYSLLIYQDNKHLKDGDKPIEINVLRGFLTNQEQKTLFDPLFDKRFNIHLLGEAIQVAYAKDTPEQYDVHRLARNAIDKCGPIFEQVEENLALGIYRDSIYIGVNVDSQFTIWLEDSTLAFGLGMAEYIKLMETRYDHAVAGRIVDPDSMDEACKLADVPKMQSHLYEYEHPELLRRRKRMAADPNECVPRSNTKACTDTEAHRKEQINKIWNILKRKHMIRKDDIEEALSICFGICGTCLQGSIYEEKVKHCSNLIHWVSFGLLNDEPHVTNFFSRDNMETRNYACNMGEECIERAPLFSVFAPSVEALYRPDPTKSVKEDLYDSVENPMPVMRLLKSLYAAHASGTVKFWVRDESDMTSMKDVLQVVTLYNHNITNVQIYATKSISKKAVEQVVQGFSRDWASTGCPSKGREFLAQFQVLDIPHHLRKRSTKYLPDLKEAMILEKRQQIYNGMEP